MYKKHIRRGNSMNLETKKTVTFKKIIIAITMSLFIFLTIGYIIYINSKEYLTKDFIEKQQLTNYVISDLLETIEEVLRKKDISIKEKKQLYSEIRKELTNGQTVRQTRILLTNSFKNYFTKDELKKYSELSVERVTNEIINNGVITSNIILEKLQEVRIQLIRKKEKIRFKIDSIPNKKHNKKIEKAEFEYIDSNGVKYNLNDFK